MNDAQPAWQLKQIAGPPVEIPVLAALVIGRGLDSDLILPDRAVSRRHARLELSGRIRIKDLGGPLGTYVNGQRITSRQLAVGDRIAIGIWQFALAEVSGLLSPHGEISIASLDNSLAVPRLELLLTFCNRINMLNDREAMARCLLEAACQGTGFKRAWLLQRQDREFKSLASLPAQSDSGEISRHLLDYAHPDQVVCLERIEQSQASESVAARRITAALVATFSELEQDYCLYLDARHQEAPPQPDAARFCQALVQMTALGFSRLEQHQRLWQQREDIYSDLHDDLGARLINLVYRAPNPEMAEEARAMLVDLRDVVSRPGRSTISLDALLGELRAEARQRAEAAGADFIWSGPVFEKVVEWDGQTAGLLSRCVRELSNNALKHAQPQTLSFVWQISNQRLRLHFEHDGSFRAPEEWQPGRGISSIRKRCRKLDGGIEWSVHAEKLRAELHLPLGLLP